MEQHCSDEHEEGEIIDDFEDISDYSIPSTSFSGKSVSNQDLLQDVSLSSISENEPDALIYLDTYSTSRNKTIHTKRRRNTVHCHRRKRHKGSDYYRRHRLSKYVNASSDSSGSSDIEIDPKTQKQLKDAIRIEQSHIHHNSLRTRLKAMLQNENIQNKTEDEDDDNALRTLALLSNSKEDIKDESKQIGDKLNDTVSVDDKDEELIELRLAALKSAVLKKVPEIRKRKCKLQPKLITNKVCEVNKENNVNQENNINEDTENMKITELPDTKLINDLPEANIETSKSIFIEEDIDIMRAKLLASMSKKITLNLPKQTVITNQPEKHIFLKKQTKIKPLIINLNDSDSDTDITTKESHQNHDRDITLVNSVNEFLRKQRAAVEARNKSQYLNQTTLDKSVVKLLPKSQQREYHLLKQKLLLAKRKRLRKPNLKNTNNNEKMVKTIPKETEFTKVTTLQQSEPKTTGLQKALEDLQIKKNGRLQMKGKYKALAPLLQKVNQASIERKKCETEIKALLDNLQNARDKLASSHQNYSNLVMRLTNQKNAIDRRINKMKFINNNVRINNTSTPMKCNIQATACDISSIHNATIDNATELKANSNDEQTGSSHVILPQINTVDGLTQCSDEGNALKQYVSPLDNKNRDIIEDPLTTFCPYELFGVCKDAECKYNHCSKT